MSKFSFIRPGDLVKIGGVFGIKRSVMRPDGECLMLFDDDVLFCMAVAVFDAQNVDWLTFGTTFSKGFITGTIVISRIISTNIEYADASFCHESITLGYAITSGAPVSARVARWW